MTYSSDESSFGTLTDGSNNLIDTSILTTNIPKQNKGHQAPDGSSYMTLKDGLGNLITT